MWIKTLKRIAIIVFFFMTLYNLTYQILPTKNQCFFGISFFIMPDKTMEPAIKKNELVLVKKEKLKVGDIIAFYSKNQVLIHRITREDANNSEICYVTKGDNNYYHDIDKVLISSIQGKVIWKNGFLGVLFIVLQSKLITGGIIVYIILRYRQYNIKKKNMRRREKKEKLL